MRIQKGLCPIVHYRKTARCYRLCFGEAECPTSWLIFTENTLISAKNSGSYVNDLRIIMRNHQKTSPFFENLQTKCSKLHCNEMKQLKTLLNKGLFFKYRKVTSSSTFWLVAPQKGQKIS